MLDSNQIYNLLQLIYKRRDREGLWHFIHDVFGVAVPRKKICPDHDAPFDFVADSFFNVYKNIIAVANRTGGKTLDFSILDVLNSYAFDDCETATVGAIEDQALKCYGYVKKWINDVPVFMQRLVSSLLSVTAFTNKSTISVLTGTMSGVNGPHPQKVFLDEIELMPWNVLQEALSMAMSKGDITGQTVITSSRKFAFGSMERLLNEADMRGFKVYTWCVMEVLEKHDPDKCRNSALHEYCQGRCLECGGYYSFDDAVGKRMSMDKDTWESQWMSRKPMSAALVYPMFDELKHVKPCPILPTLPIHISEDFGFATGHADVVGFWQFLPGGKKRMVGEIWVEGKTDDEIILLVEDWIYDHGLVPDRYKGIKGVDKNIEEQGYYNRAISTWACPIEEPSKMALRRRKGYKVIYQEQKEFTRINYGIPLIRKDLEDEMLEIDSSCRLTIMEMKSYANRVMANGTILDEPNKVNDNGPDMIRYMYINNFANVVKTSLSKANNKRSSSSLVTAGYRDIAF